MTRVNLTSPSPDTALRLPMEWPSAILDALPAHLAVLDAEGVIVEVNEAWRRFARANAMNRDDFGVGMNYLAVGMKACEPEKTDGQAAAEGIRQVLRGELAEYSREYPCHSPTKKRWYRLMVAPVQVRGRRGAVAMHLDVTERRLAEEKLKVSEERFRATFEQSAVGMAHVSAEGRFLRVNQKLCEITGYAEAELLELRFSHLTLPEDQEKSARAQRAMLAGELEAFTVEKRYIRKDGSLVWVNLVSTLAKDVLAEERYFISVFEEVTERKQAEARLQRMNRLYAVLSRIADVIVRTEKLQPLYDEACRILVEEGLLKLALVVEAEAATGSIRTLASFGENGDYLEGLAVTSRDEPLGQGTIGTAIRNGRYNVCNDIQTDRRMAPWHETASRHGFQATASFPLKIAGETVGALVVFADEAGYFKEDEVRLMVTVAHDLSFAIEALDKESQRQQTEKALRQSEASMALAQSIAHFGSWELDLTHPEDIDSNALSWSDEMFRIAGYEPGTVQVSNELFFQLAHPDDRELIRTTIATAVQERQPYSVIHRLIRPDGEERTVHETARLFFDEATGKLQKMVGTARDITESQRTEQARRESEEKFTQLVENMTDVFWICSPEGDLQYVSAAYEVIWGRKAADLYGKVGEWQKSIVPEDRQRVGEMFATLGEEGAKMNAEYRILRPDGSLRWVYDRGFQIRDEAGRLVRLAGIATDITERKNLEQQFLRAQRMESIGTLAGGIAHDLNNALTPILMSIELLKLTEKDEMRLGVLDTIETSTKRGADMVKQVLTFARGAEGERVALEMKPLLREVEKMCRETFLKTIEVKSEMAADLWTVSGDATQLHQVLVNLCVNARDAMPQGGLLKMGCQNVELDGQYAAMNLEARAGRYVKVWVEDTGQGMAPAVVERIFEPFYTTKELGKGTGLGLSTTLAIVKSHGGFIRVTSEVNRGTSFRFYLPATEITAAEAGPGGETPPKAMLPRGGGELILLVEDEVPVREITQQTLEAFGYRVIAASDGAEAVGLYAQRKQEVAVVLTDMMMPVMDGPTMIPVLLRLNPQVKIVAASGLNANGMVAKAAGLGVRHFIPKPYTAEMLLKTLKEVMG